MKLSIITIVIFFAMMSYLLHQYVWGGPGNLTVVKATDGHSYRVQDLPDKQAAAEMLAKIRANISKVVALYSQDEYLADTPARLLVERYDASALMENSMTSSDTSYSENKGEKIVLCLRNKDSPPSYPLIELNTVMFVVLHEMAHLMTESLSAHSHTPVFWANFRRLLEDSAKIGIWTAVNYSKQPVAYCGMMITDSPL
jgi:hypothetical protein